MISIKTTFSSPIENLAFDEALVEVADKWSSNDTVLGPGRRAEEVLRIWEMPSVCVILGRASKRMLEVNELACERDRVPVLRRVSGGATVVAGPGCLMYSALISYESRPSWRMLDQAHAQVMNRIQAAVQQTLVATGILGNVELKGTCDLTLNDRKFSGNALRCKRNWMLYHGTIIYSMELEMLGKYLLEPPRQPEYRENREHLAFVTKLLPMNSQIPIDTIRASLERELSAAWAATASQQPTDFLDAVEVESQRLQRERYSSPNWHRHL
jgi:lipoate-protein ligase A